MFKKKKENETDLSLNNMNGLTNQARVCDITNMNCLDTEDEKTGHINDLNQKSSDEAVVCSLNDMNCTGEN